jgi:uncharacterized membrane protein YebE (DUF533 family)
MPVRIVKDNPDEEVVNDSFDFDNPSGDSDNQNYEDNQNSDDYNNEGNSNNSDSGFDLSGIANMLFGGGGRGNSALSSLSSLAIGACVGYAVNYFQQSKSSATTKNTGSSHSKDDLEDLYQARMAASTICVSLWGYAVGADRDFNQDEEQAVGNLLEDTIQNLFPSNVANQDEVRQELTEIFNNPIPYEDIIGQASQNRNFAMQLYQQAALIVAADGNYQRRERDFLTNLAQDLGLSSSDVNPIHRKFGL